MEHWEVACNQLSSVVNMSLLNIVFLYAFILLHMTQN